LIRNIYERGDIVIWTILKKSLMIWYGI
jgi:hypothetical protein